MNCSYKHFSQIAMRTGIINIKGSITCSRGGIGIHIKVLISLIINSFKDTIFQNIFFGQELSHRSYKLPKKRWVEKIFYNLPEIAI